MKQFLVEQAGFVRVEVCRRFVVEVPDDFSEEQAQRLVDDVQESFPDEEGMGWRDELDRRWVGYDVEITESDVYDPDTVLGAPATDGLSVIKLEGKSAFGRQRM